MSFSSNKASRFDKVTMSVIKDALPCILPVLTDIVNRSLLSSVFPAAWKISEVIPLLKDGDHEIPNNNRPVSLLPAASKICERVALNQLMTYMTTKKRLSEHQSGNKKLHSCETLNVMITDKALEAMDAKKVTLVVLLDLSKAFDSIDHVTLLAKLQALGVSVHLWIGSRATFLNGCNVSGSKLRPQACRVSHMESHRVQSWGPPCLLSTSTTLLLYRTCVL